MLYDSHEAPRRRRVKLTFEGVSNITTRLDFAELSGNRNAGSISYGYIKKDNSKSKNLVLWLYMTDGFLEIRFKSGYGNFPNYPT
jgi:hypothetical protein